MVADDGITFHYLKLVLLSLYGFHISAFLSSFFNSSFYVKKYKEPYSSLGTKEDFDLRRSAPSTLESQI